MTECAAELGTRFGVSELSLFGSVARDEARDDSDVDVMVSFFSTLSFTSFMELTLRAAMPEVPCALLLGFLPPAGPLSRPPLEQSVHAGNQQTLVEPDERQSGFHPAPRGLRERRRFLGEFAISSSAAAIEPATWVQSITFQCRNWIREKP